MIRGSFWHWKGYVIIKVKGPHLERFLNAAVRASVVLRDTERLTSEMLVAKVSVLGFRRLRAVVRSSPWHLSIVQRVGLPFLIQRAMRRKALLVGGLLGLLFLYVLSTVVWFVEVEGAAEVPKEAILTLAADHGLRPGSLKGSFSGKVVERELLLTLDRLSWAYVEVSGTLVTIHVAEKVVPNQELTQPGDIEAAFSGIIDELVVMRGIPMVEEGDTVTAGQLLISGQIPPGSSMYAEKTSRGEAPYIKAEGVIKARVWHQGLAEAVLQNREESLTGSVHRQAEFSWRKASFLWGKPAPYETYQESVWEWQPGIGRWRLPAKIRIVKSEETKVSYTPVAESVALELARQAAWDQVQAQLPPGAVITEPSRVEVEKVTDKGLDVMRVRITLEALENIRKFRPYAASTEGPGVYRPTLGPIPKVQPVPGP